MFVSMVTSINPLTSFPSSTFNSRFSRSYFVRLREGDRGVWWLPGRTLSVSINSCAGSCARRRRVCCAQSFKACWSIKNACMHACAGYANEGSDRLQMTKLWHAFTVLDSIDTCCCCWEATRFRTSEIWHFQVKFDEVTYMWTIIACELARIRRYF